MLSPLACRTLVCTALLVALGWNPLRPVTSIRSPADAGAQDCIDYADHIRWLGSVSTADNAGDIVTAGDYAYAIAGGGFHVIDVTDPTDLQLVVYFQPIGTVYKSVAIEDDTAYLGAGASGLHIVDITDPAAPEVTGTADTPGYAIGVAVGAGIAYVADREGGLQIVDVSDPTSPGVIGAITTSGDVLAVDTLAPSHVVIGDGAAAFRVIDVGDPTAPSIAGGTTIPDEPLRIRVADEYAYVACGFAGMQIIDLLTPSAPIIVGQVNPVESVADVDVVEHIAYIAMYSDWLEPNLLIADVSDAQSPVELGALRIPDVWGRAIAACGDRVYFFADDRAAANASVHALDVSHPTLPPVVGAMNLPWVTQHVAVSGSLLAVAATRQCQIVDVSDPGSPELLGVLDLEDYATDIAIMGDHALVIRNLLVVDISDPTTPTLVAQVGLPGGGTDIEVDGTLVYVTAVDFHIYDLADPLSPELLASAEVPLIAWDVSVSGSHAYVSDGGVQVFDISNPHEPTLIASLDTFGSVTDLVADGSLLFVTGGAGGVISVLEIFDVGDPGEPDLLSSIELIDVGYEIRVLDGYVYVAASQLGIEVIDVSDPRSPRRVGMANTPFTAAGLTVDDSCVYVAIQSHGLHILPAQCASTVAIASHQPTSMAAARLTAIPNPARGGTTIDYALTAPAHIQLQVFDVTGRCVRRLSPVSLATVSGTAWWDGRDGGGRRLGSGVYFVKLTGAGQPATARLTLIR